MTPARKRAISQDTPVTVGRFRLEQDRFVRVDSDGDVVDEVTTAGLSLAIVERRDLGCMVFFLVSAVAVVGGLWACAGGYGASASLCPGLVLLFLAFTAWLKGDKLEVTTSAKTQVWSIHSDTNSLELQLLVARVNGVIGGEQEAPREADSTRSERAAPSGDFTPHPDTDWYRPGVLVIKGVERRVAVTAASVAQAQHIVGMVSTSVRGADTSADQRELPLVMTLNPATLPESDNARAILEAAADEATALTHYRPGKPFDVTCSWSI